MFIVGPNGAGKSTVFRAVSGLLQPRQGDVQLEGQSLCGLHRRASSPWGAQVPQSNALFPGLTAKENVLMGAYIQRRDKKLLESAKTPSRSSSRWSASARRTARATSPEASAGWSSSPFSDAERS